MRILNCSVFNFGSYKSLSFDFSQAGLALVHGATGSGKSTLQDVVSWILFGTTTKDGNVDEVRNWKAQEEPTVGTLFLENKGAGIYIVRTRGTSKQNDLFFSPQLCDERQHRGKDLADTQKLINDLLGVDADTYNTATSFNEFSESALFFLAKPASKRLVFEKCCNMTFPAKVAAKMALARKEAKKQLAEAENKVLRLSDRAADLEKHIASSKAYSDGWEQKKSDQIKKLEVLQKGFDKEKSSNIEALQTKSYVLEEAKSKKVDDLVDKLDALGQRFDGTRASKEERLKKAQLTLPKHCDKCGRANNTSAEIERLKADIEKSNLIDRQFSEYSVKLRDVQAALNPYKDQIIELRSSKNHYSEQIVEKTKESNPFQEQYSKLLTELPSTQLKLKDKIESCNQLRNKCSGVEELYDMSFDLRGLLLKNTVQLIQNNTNDYLSKYFDSEFTVGFELSDADSVEVSIKKNGYPCVFKQLSKGQRQMLKLCFAVSVMRAAANNSDVGFNLLTFDEALTGFDSALKAKAYRLFEELSKTHDSVIVIEHDTEFQSMFTNKYKVELVSDESIITNE